LPHGGGERGGGGLGGGLGGGGSGGGGGGISFIVAHGSSPGPFVTFGCTRAVHGASVGGGGGGGGHTSSKGSQLPRQTAPARLAEGARDLGARAVVQRAREALEVEVAEGLLGRAVCPNVGEHAVALAR